tara:strand:+ start:755 stop:931 length:177 start_codon:yes stop_codon:yes gene_type:complete
MTNYQTALRRIANAKTTKDLQKVEVGLTRVYDAGFFTENEFMRLDGKILDRLGGTTWK